MRVWGDFEHSPCCFHWSR